MCVCVSACMRECGVCVRVFVCERNNVGFVGMIVWERKYEMMVCCGAWGVILAMTVVAICVRVRVCVRANKRKIEREEMMDEKGKGEGEGVDNLWERVICLRFRFFFFFYPLSNLLSITFIHTITQFIFFFKTYSYLTLPDMISQYLYSESNHNELHCIVCL